MHLQLLSCHRLVLIFGSRDNDSFISNHLFLQLPYMIDHLVIAKFSELTNVEVTHDMKICIDLILPLEHVPFLMTSFK